MQIGFRVTAALRRRLEYAANRNQRTLTEEVELRLRSTLGDPDAAQAIFGGPANHWLLMKLATYIRTIERTTGQRWWRDPYTFKQVWIFFDRLFGFFEPLGSPDVPPKFANVAGGLGAAFAGRALMEVQGALAGARLEADVEKKPGTNLAISKLPPRFTKGERRAFFDGLESLNRR